MDNIWLWNYIHTHTCSNWYTSTPKWENSINAEHLHVLQLEFQSILLLVCIAFHNIALRNLPNYYILLWLTHSQVLRISQYVTILNTATLLGLIRTWVCISKYFVSISYHFFEWNLITIQVKTQHYFDFS